MWADEKSSGWQQETNVAFFSYFVLAVVWLKLDSLFVAYPMAAIMPTGCLITVSREKCPRFLNVNKALKKREGPS